MAKSQPELEFLLLSNQASIIDDFIRYVANGRLTRYKAIIQWGKKAGEPLYVHVMNGVFIAEAVRGLISLTQEETRVLFSAFVIHDLNKALDAEKKSFNRLATPQAVKAELESVGVPGFFPEYERYLEDITLLIRSHSGHYHTSSEWLIPAHNPYVLPRERLDILRDLMTALDELEMSSTLDERDHKNAFLSFLNAHSGIQYEFVHHKVTEQRGLLTNVIHNQAKQYLNDRFGCVPLLYYPDGVAYLHDKSHPFKVTVSDLSEIGTKVAEASARMTRGEFAKFINSGNQGIKVDPQVLDLGVSFADIFGVIYSQVEVKISAKRFFVGDKASRQKPNQDPEGKYRKDLEDVLADPKRKKIHESAQRLLTRQIILPQTQELMGVGELLRSYYIFLSDHFKEKVGDAWEYVYTWLGLDNKQTALYESLDPRYQRAYVVAGDLELRLSDLFERILKDGAKLMPELEANRNQPSLDFGEYEVLRAYVAQQVTFNTAVELERDFSKSLLHYVTHNHEQCAYCGSEFETDRLMAPQVPENVGVQSFSNRLKGGSKSEPKRNVCSVCRIQFILEKLNFAVGGNTKTIYLHLFPHTFFTEPFLVCLRTQLREILNQETHVLFPKTDEAIREFVESEGSRIRLPFYTRNKQDKPYVNGVALPLNYAEAIGNMLTFPLNCPGDNDSEQFWFAVQNALLIARFFGCKALVSDSPMPVLGKADFGSLYLDNAPASFGGLLPTNDFDYTQLKELWRDVANLFRLRSALYNSKSEAELWLPLIYSLTSEHRLEIFHSVDRLIEAKSENEGQAIGLVKLCLPFVQALLPKQGVQHMKPLQTLAEMAWRDHIIGSSLKRNSLIKPLDMMLDGLEAKSEAFGLDTLRAQLTEDVFRHLEVIADDQYKPGKTKHEKVKAYVDAFFDGVLEGVYPVGAKLRYKLSRKD